jgi:hypothetical protein
MKNPTQAPSTNDFKPNLLLTLGKNQMDEPLKKEDYSSQLSLKNCGSNPNSPNERRRLS